MHFLGLAGMPRRIADYPGRLCGLELRLLDRRLHLLRLDAVLRLYRVPHAFYGKRVGENYWGEGATTLEWKVPSPPPFHSVRRVAGGFLRSGRAGVSTFVRRTARRRGPFIARSVGGGCRRLLGDPEAAGDVAGGVHRARRARGGAGPSAPGPGRSGDPLHRGRRGCGRRHQHVVRSRHRRCDAPHRRAAPAIGPHAAGRGIGLWRRTRRSDRCWSWGSPSTGSRPVSWR